MGKKAKVVQFFCKSKFLFLNSNHPFLLFAPLRGRFECKITASMNAENLSFQSSDASIINPKNEYFGTLTRFLEAENVNCSLFVGY